MVMTNVDNTADTSVFRLGPFLDAKRVRVHRRRRRRFPRRDRAVHGWRRERCGLQRQRQGHGRRAGRRSGRSAYQRGVPVVRHRPVPMRPGLVAPAFQQPEMPNAE